MSASRVCIQTDRNGDPVAVDVVLPSATRLGELLPSIVRLVDDCALPGDSARRWQLRRACGDSLDQSLSLMDNGIRDGELLLLDADGAPSLGSVRRSPCQEASATQPVDNHAGKIMFDTVAVLTTTLAATALAATAGSEAATTHAIIAAVAAVAAAVVTVATGYPTTASIGVVTLACTAGFLVVPSGPAAPNVFLAASAAVSTSLLILRLSGRSSPVLTATAALSLLTAAVTLVAMPLAVVGAALSTASLGLLALAPRLSVLTVGLGPNHWHGSVAESAAAAHAVLSGLVAGCAVGATSGAVVVAVADQAGSAPFTCLVGSILLLRSRTYVDKDRRIAIVAGGLATLIACLCIVVNTHREGVGPIACVLVVIGLIAVRRPNSGATVSRMLDRLEYAASAAVIPVACWVGGAYTAVGGFGPP